MNVDSIKNGIVLDHITAGRAMEIYRYLHLDELDCSVAIIQNVYSNKSGRKDILKIDAEIDVDYEILGFLDPAITVNVIKNDERVEKRALALPGKLKNVIKCKNPRCITTTEQEIDQVFMLNEGGSTYRCAYCETIYEGR